MIIKLKLTCIIVGLHAFTSGFCQINNDTTEDSIKKSGQISEWKEQIPTISGWRAACPGITIEELIKALPEELSRTKKIKFTNGTKGQEVSLKKKIEIDGMDYKVSFSFDSDGHLIIVSFLCNNKVRKESYSSIVASFTGLIGEPTKREANSTTDGTLGQSFSQDWESCTWKQGNSLLSVLSFTMRSHLIVTGRFVQVSMYYGE